MGRAYGAGMQPSEFYDIAPVEVLFWVEKRTGNNVHDAWMRGYVTQLAKNAKKYPSDPRNLPFWPKPRDELRAVDETYERVTSAFGG